MPGREHLVLDLKAQHVSQFHDFALKGSNLRVGCTIIGLPIPVRPTGSPSFHFTEMNRF